jgi:Cdc6-like AAA superfamily ATPase
MPPELTRAELLLDAFRPEYEMDDPAQFAGRAKEIGQLARALQSKGSCPIIYGDRGLGKSSLALQGLRIALGDSALLERHNLEKWAIPPSRAFLTIYVRASDATLTKDAILQRVLNSAIDGFGREIWGEETYQLTERSRTIGLDLKVLSAEFGKKFQPMQEDPGYVALSVEEKLLEVCKLISAVSKRRLLIVIDELDRARNATGLASFIKSSSSRELKFMLVGIGQSVSDLLTDHRSLERSGHAIPVPRMTDPELEAIVDQAMTALRARGVEMSFEASARRVTANTASGYPWFVHVLGQDALIRADEDGRSVVRVQDIQAAAEELTLNRFAQQFADLYQQAVRDSPRREILLRMIAKWPGRDIPTAEIYRRVRDPRLGIASPSTYKGHLCSEQYGRILLTPPYQDRGMVRFANEMFKVYVRIRSSLYEDVKDNVDEVWRDHGGA